MMSRRDLLKLSSAVAIAPSFSVFARGSDPVDSHAPDYRIEIAPLTLELSARHRLRTVAYNGQVPGPLLRFREGRPTTIEVANHSDGPEVVHWHGLFLPPEVDGAAEVGTPLVAPNTIARYRFTPRPSGFRWYHTHTMAMGDLTRAQYGGQHGFLMVESGDNPGRYDQEFFLALHDWDGRLLASDDGAMNPSYQLATINGKVMGFGEPLRVRQGQRVLLHVLNTSPTEVHWIALAGHRLQVIALDGNPVPSACEVPMLRLAPGERVCAVVEMNNPGIWTCGEVRKHVRAAGMAIAVEYADQQGSPEWQQPTDLIWSYEQFAGAQSIVEPIEAPVMIPLVIESKFRGHGSMEAWTINGKSYPDTSAAPLQFGRRHRLQFVNQSMDDHPLHLHRHSFELHKLGTPLGAAGRAAPRITRGIIKDVVLIDSQTMAEVDFIADNPGASLLHCHQQSHMDLGFMLRFNYA